MNIWADEIVNPIGFCFTRTSYKQKKGHSIVSIYLRSHQYGEIRGQVYDLDNAGRQGTRSRACGCLFMIIGYCRKYSILH